ncbi:hypothetical protein POTOM_003522 [Populus tomentosa]|uniref:Pentatricopeptide repeat-containing protein n=2 Tax=Populus TaxID=3689 RepID=A0A8X8DLU2_POPTO|nr:hypothetical protein POTOM_003522 [Populus tomentosa]
MVDLCARAGLLNKAWDLIKKMPGKRDEIVDAIISSKIYANMRRWDDSAKMRKCGVSKTPGCSWIDVGARAHEFHAGGSLHHHSENIYQLLNEEMKR